MKAKSPMLPQLAGSGWISPASPKAIRIWFRIQKRMASRQLSAMDSAAMPFLLWDEERESPRKTMTKS